MLAESKPEQGRWSQHYCWSFLNARKKHPDVIGLFWGKPQTNRNMQPCQADQEGGTFFFFFFFTVGVFVYRLQSISSCFTCTCVLTHHKPSGVSSCANTTVKPPEWLPFSKITSPATHENMLPLSHMWACFYIYEVQVSGRNGTHWASSVLFLHITVV